MTVARGSCLGGEAYEDRRRIVNKSLSTIELLQRHTSPVPIGLRDLDVIIDEDYGLTVYATQRSFHGSVEATPAEENGQIQCGGALVRPVT